MLPKMLLSPLLVLATFYLTTLVSAQSTASCVPSTTDFKWPSQFVRSGPSNLRVITQGHGPTILILPSLGRDGGDDFSFLASSLSLAGFLVLRPQPRGTLGSTGPMTNVSLYDLALDVANVIDALGGGSAILIGHAFGHGVAQVVAATYPEKVPAVVFAAAQTSNVPGDIARTPGIVANLSLPAATRLQALQTGFFAPGHDASIWLTGWYPATIAMEQGAIASFTGNMSAIVAGSPETQVLEVIADDDPFEVRERRGDLQSLYPDRVTSTVVYNASHALFPEQPRKVVEAMLPWLKAQSSKLNAGGRSWDEL